MVVAQRLSLDELESAVGQGRRSLSYAVLHSLFNSTERSENPVKDVVDCFIPFVRHALQDQVNNQIDFELLKAAISSKYGIDIPIYTLEYIVPLLQSEGTIEYDSISRAYFVRNIVEDRPDDSINIKSSISDIEVSIGEYVSRLGAGAALYSANWPDALISFLKPSSDPRSSPKIVKDVLVSNPIEIERYIIADYIKTCHDQKLPTYDAIINVFVGVLIEDFINNMSSYGSVDSYPNMSVYYDTGLILRILGTSGYLLERATKELHRYIGDLGIKSEYFANNEDEVANILSAIVNQSNTRSGIYGETGEAISRGEVTIGSLRELEQIFVDRLAAYSIFPARYEKSGFQRHVHGQIDERKFTDNLVREASLRDRSYSQENAEHDAISLGHVMRMRRGARIRDLSECPGIFITSNRLLATYSRRFLIEEGQLRKNDISPVFHVSQACTVFWLAKDRDIDEIKAGHQLLANCYDALRPDDNFYQELFKKINAYENIGEGDPAIVTTVRRIAKQEAFGRTAILNVLSPNEILSRAREEVAIKEQEHRAQTDRAKAEAESSGRKAQSAERELVDRRKCDTMANIAVTILEVVLCTALSVFAILDIFGFRNSDSFSPYLVVAAVIAVLLSFFDYFGIWHMRSATGWLRRWVSSGLYRRLYEEGV